MRYSKTGWRIACPLVAAAALTIAAAAPSTARAQGSIAGWVTADATKEPVSGGRVMLVGTSVTTCTGLDGRYVFTNIAAGTAQVRILAVPFAPTLKPVTVTDGSVAILDFALPGAPLRIGGDEVKTHPSPSQLAVGALFKTITLTADAQARAEAIFAKSSAARRAADPKSPDYLGTLDDLAEKRNAELKALLTSDADRATFAANLKNNPDTGCPVR